MYHGSVGSKCRPCTDCIAIQYHDMIHEDTILKSIKVHDAVKKYQNEEHINGD